MIKESDLIGLPLIDKDGKEVACAIGALYSKHNDELVGVLVSTGKLLKRNQMIDFKNILSIDSEEIYIQDKFVFNKLKSLPSSQIYSKSLIGQEILTLEKNSIGYIRDVLIDKDKGKVIAFILTEGIIDDLSKGRSVIPFDNKMIFKEEHIIVNSSVEEDFTKNREGYKKLLELL